MEVLTKKERGHKGCMNEKCEISSIEREDVWGHYQIYL